MKKRSTFLYALRSSVPVMAGYLVLGASFGMLLQSRGFGVGYALLMSGGIYAGSMQFLAVDLLTSGAGLLTAALLTFSVNARHIFYSISMLDPYKDTGRYKPYLIFALSDETFSLVCSPHLPENVDCRLYYLYVSALDQLYWVAGSLAGSLLFQVFPFPTTGIEFSMTALFLVIVLEQWEHSENHAPVLTGILSSLICLALLGADRFLLPAMLLTVMALLLEKKLLPSHKPTGGGSQ